MKQITNCKNCGAALDIWAPKCAFCGTKNINLTSIDLDSGEAVNFIFKMPSNIRVYNGAEKQTYLTTLAIPKLDMITAQADTTNFYDGYGKKSFCTTGMTMEMGLTLHPVSNPYKHDALCEIRVGDL